MSSDLPSLCTELAQNSGNIILKQFRPQEHHITYKADKSLVTELDAEIEIKLIRKIQRIYPNHNIHGEEGGDSYKGSHYTWYLDPIDGTTNFAFGIPLFGTQIAVSYKNDILASAIFLPRLNLLFTAIKDKGAKLNGKPIRCDYNTTLDKITLIVDCGKSPEAKKSLYNFIQQNNNKFRSFRQFGCVISHLTFLPYKQLNVSMIIDAPTHDLLPLALFYKEAGFTTQNREGDNWTINDKDLIAANPNLEKQMKHLVKSTKW